MTSKAQSIRVGLFATATLVLVALVLIVFGGFRFWEASDRYRIVFDSSVIGLEPGAVVYLNGIKVGTVDSLAVEPSDLRKVAVAIDVEPGTPIRTDTRAMLQYAGITGLKVIDLRDGSTAAAPLLPGGEIPAGAGLLDKLEARAQAIIDQSAALMDRATVLTDNLIAVTEPARLAATNLAELSGSLKGMIDENRAGLRQSVVTLRRSLAAFGDAANGASQLVDGQVAQLVVNAGDAVSSFRKLLTANEGPLRAAVFDLREASRSFKELARDVRQKPSRLLFSNAPEERKLP
ncbi:MAG TPA: MlaD family protein [Kofleriaceae bacterium]|nr:MlaD family protein [Kofleriaceae bacterium]